MICVGPQCGDDDTARNTANTWPKHCGLSRWAFFERSTEFGQGKVTCEQKYLTSGRRVSADVQAFPVVCYGKDGG